MPKFEAQSGAAESLAYRLAMAFPNWAGAFLAVYSVLLWRFRRF